MRVASTLGVLCVLLAGCLEGGPAGTQPPFDESMRTLAHGANSGVSSPLSRALESASAWEALWAEHTRGVSEEPAPDVDFSQERVLAVTLGTRPNGCYAVTITRAETDLGAGTTRVVAVERTPRAGEACTQALTSPFHFVAVPARDTRVAFDVARDSEAGAGGVGGEDGEPTPATPAPTPTPPPTPVTPTAAPAGPVEYRVVDEGRSSGVREALRVEVTTRADWDALWARHASNQLPPPEAPAVDFARERVAAAFLGDRPNACHRLEARGVERDADGALVVKLARIEPGPDAVCADMVAQPYVMLVTPAGKAPVAWSETTERA